MRRAFTVVMLGLAFGQTQPAFAVEHQVYGALAAEASVSPETSVAGILLAHYRGLNLIGDVDLDLIYNTDTLRLRLSDYCISAVCLGAHIEGEALMAGLLTKYWREGQLLDSQGFNASWIAGGLFAKIDANPAFIYYGATVRHWLFSRSDANPVDFVLPTNTTVLEQQLSFAYWGLASDKSLSEPHRMFPRYRGFAFGFDVQVDLRRQTKAWGAPEDPRNQPEPFSSQFKQWASFGHQFHSRVRLQVKQEAFVSRGLDDLSRRRVGGLNPYVAPVAGAPWNAFLSDQHLMFRTSLHGRIWQQVEAGLIFDAGILQDPLRQGDNNHGAVVGMGLFADAPLGPVDIFAAAGWSPPGVWQQDNPHLSVFAGVGSRLW